MEYSVLELAWLYLFYAFAGWVLEVCAAALKKKKFINRGFVTGPLCPIYGTGAVLFAVFLPELKDSPFFLFLGGMILASLVEYFTGVTLERFFHKKWWDYSGERWNFDGYICLKYSALWGGCAVLAILFFNPLLCRGVALLPEAATGIGAAVMMGILVLDTLGTALAIPGLKREMKQMEDLTENLHQVSKLLENAITRRIQGRMRNAFPNLQKAGEAAYGKSQAPPVFAQGCSFYKLTALFFIGAFLGDVTETVFCLITEGVLMSRSSVVYGPFSIVWGLGCALLTGVLYRWRDRKPGYVFVAGTLLGGAYEYICSVFTELVFGTVFWDYSDFTFNLGGRINLLFCFFWGIAAVVWMKLLYPWLSGWIERIPIRPGKLLCLGMLVFMTGNMALSGLALDRYSQRQEAAGKEREAENSLNRFLDEHFPNERMEKIYPKAKMVS